jgi:hypothetical protein
LKTLCQQKDLQRIKMVQHQFSEVDYTNKLKVQISKKI